MPGSVGPPPEDYDLVVTETVVRDSACGLNSHEPDSLNQLLSDLVRRNDDGWELLSAHRSVLVPSDAQHDAGGAPIRGRLIRHELAFRRSPPRRRWEYGIDALSDPDELNPGQVMADRFLQGWELVGASRFTFEAVTPDVDHDELVHRTEDAVLFWKRPQKRKTFRPKPS
ncbi:MAG: hypothetical protein ACXWCB_05805 [Acidimicrobiales bacterium]